VAHRCIIVIYEVYWQPSHITFSNGLIGHSHAAYNSPDFSLSTYSSPFSDLNFTSISDFVIPSYTTSSALLLLITAVPNHLLGGVSDEESVLVALC